MFNLRFARSLVALGVAAGPLLAEAGPVAPSTPPTPAPCTADGYCQPDRLHFGYTTPKWRRWPGSAEKEQQAGPGGGIPDIGPVDPPRPEREDQMAPPPIEAIEPRPRDIDMPSERFDDEPGVAPRRPGDEPLPPRVPDDRRVPDNRFVPPADDAPDFLRNAPAPGINVPAIPPVDTPPPFGPGLNQPGAAPVPPGQPPTGPAEPTLPAPAGGGRDPGDDFFPNFKISGNSDDAPPALPFRVARGAETKGWAPAAPSRGGVSAASMTTPPQPTAPPTSHRTGNFAPRSGGERKFDTQVQRTSFEQDAPPTLPATFLQ